MVWRTLSLCAVFLALGCEREPGSGESPEPTAASEIWMAEQAGGSPFINDNFGVIAHFPVDAWVCPGLSGGNPHGFYTRLGGQFSCPPASDATRVSAYGVWANWNAAFDRTLDEARGDRPCWTDVRFSSAPDGRGFALRGLESRVCVTQRGDTWFTVEVEAFDGRWGGQGEEADTPRVHYTATLTTRPGTWARDAPLFATFLEHLTVGAPQDCFWTPGKLFVANGTPSLRIEVDPSGRVLGVTSARGPESEDALPPDVWSMLRNSGDAWSTEINGEWRVCPLEPDRPGEMRMVTVHDARGLRTR